MTMPSWLLASAQLPINEGSSNHVVVTPTSSADDDRATTRSPGERTLPSPLKGQNSTGVTGARVSPTTVGDAARQLLGR